MHDGSEKGVTVGKSFVPVRKDARSPGAVSVRALKSYYEGQCERAAMEGVRTAICERANGAGFGGSFIAVHPARSTLLRSGFVWRPAELAAFVDAARKGQAQTFVATTLKHMDGFASYGALLIRAWTCCNVTGSLACTKATAHS